jgi:hypothetical protein
MNDSIRRSLASALVALAACVPASGIAAGAGAKPQGKSLLSVLHPRLAGSSVTCAADNGPCPVSVEMTQVPFEGYTYCLAKLPAEIKVMGTGSIAAPKEIVWNLVPATIGPAKFSFEANNGILIVSDPKLQNPKGKLGTSPAQFIVKNKRKISGEAVYLPVIVQTDADGVATLCGAWDPKIINM